MYIHIRVHAHSSHTNDFILFGDGGLALDLYQTPCYALGNIQDYYRESVSCTIP